MGSYRTTGIVPTALGDNASENSNPIAVISPRTGQLLKPQPLDRSTTEIARSEDPRVKLAEWMTDPNIKSTIANSAQRNRSIEQSKRAVLPKRTTMLDVSLGNQSSRTCEGTSRRDFLRIGGLSALGLSLPGLLRAESSGIGRHGAARAKAVILIYLGGGLSHHDSFDPKPEAPEEVRGKYRAIDTNVPGLRIGELLPMMAKTMNRVALVRSGSHDNDHHETATNWVLSGRFGSAFGDYPAMGAVVAHHNGFSGTIPPYVAIPRNPSFTWELGKSAFLGGQWESFKAGDPNQNSYRVRDVSPSDDRTSERVVLNGKLRDAVDTLASRVEEHDQLATYDECRQQAHEMILSSAARRAFDLDHESSKLRDRYGRTPFGQSCLLARRLVEGGVRFVTVNYGGWDHHRNIWEGLENKLPEFDRGFAALIEDMSQRGLLEDTLVLAMGEFGRTPKINKDTGRDHWGPAASLLFAGAGVREGLVLGSTDKHGGYVTHRPVRPADVAWTVYESLGIDPTQQLLTPDGRPVEILDEGEPVRELFGA